MNTDAIVAADLAASLWPAYSAATQRRATLQHEALLGNTEAAAQVRAAEDLDWELRGRIAKLWAAAAMGFGSRRRPMIENAAVASAKAWIEERFSPGTWDVYIHEALWGAVPDSRDSAFFYIEEAQRLAAD